jgi:hypothetical protein
MVCHGFVNGERRDDAQRRDGTARQHAVGAAVRPPLAICVTTALRRATIRTERRGCVRFAPEIGAGGAGFRVLDPSAYPQALVLGLAERADRCRILYQRPLGVARSAATSETDFEVSCRRRVVFSSPSFFIWRQECPKRPVTPPELRPEDRSRRTRSQARLPSSPGNAA